MCIVTNIITFDVCMYVTVTTKNDDWLTINKEMFMLYTYIIIMYVFKMLKTRYVVVRCYNVSTSKRERGKEIVVCYKM